MIVKVPRILLPRGIDMVKWATVACDQFCAEPGYWKELEAFVGDAPSTLHVTCPEIYLNRDLGKRIGQIHLKMHAYLDSGILEEEEGMILVERQVGDEVRVGLMVAVDLESYDWHRVRVPLRATEDTLVERLPVRIKIRERAPLELPHAMILIDDKAKSVIEPIYAARDRLTKVYDFDLNMNGGHIRGYRVADGDAVIARLNALLDPALQTEKYGSDAGILFAVGDGNHSIAAAKVMWDELKQDLTAEEREDHPARYILLEVVNIYGGGMDFEPIHRYIYEPAPGFVEGLKEALQGEGKLKLAQKGSQEWISAPAKASDTIHAVQAYIERYLKSHPDVKVEYVHSEEHLAEVIAKEGGLGIVMPKFPTEELFPYVVNVGNLPKKAFSIGEPEQKRYYLESKFIVR